MQNTTAHKDRGSAFLNFTLLGPCVRGTDHLPLLDLPSFAPLLYYVGLLHWNSESSTAVSFSDLTVDEEMDTNLTPRSDLYKGGNLSVRIA